MSKSKKPTKAKPSDDRTAPAGTSKAGTGFIAAVVFALLAVAFAVSGRVGATIYATTGSTTSAAAASAKVPTRIPALKRVANDAEESGAEGTDASAAVPADAPEVPDYVAAEAELVPAADGATSAGRCVDRGDATLCPYWAGMGECESNPEYMRAECAKSCRACEESAEEKCRDRDTTGACATWAQSGECEKNPTYMKLRCAASCHTCDWLDYKKRCPMAPDRLPAVPNGTMHASFERAVAEYAHLSPQVLSRDPWVVAFDDFLSADEVARILHHGEGRYERSTASGGRKDDEFVPLTSDIRTSWTTWCDNETCTDDPMIKEVYNRVSNVTQVPPENFEYLQLLRYKPCAHAGAPDCQFYRRHHDTIPELVTMQPGPRVYTFFLYLSDVEEGGGTRFDGGFTVQPKAGKAIWWPATLDADTFRSDDRTHHEALPVTKGVKYAANFWLHQFDYVTPHKNGCTS